MALSIQPWFFTSSLHFTPFFELDLSPMGGKLRPPNDPFPPLYRFLGLYQVDLYSEFAAGGAQIIVDTFSDKDQAFRLDDLNVLDPEGLINL